MIGAWDHFIAMMAMRKTSGDSEMCKYDNIHTFVMIIIAQNDNS